MRGRATRRHNRRKVIARRVRQARDRYVEVKDEGRLADRSPCDCGHARCGLCHPHKLNPGIERQRRKREAREQVKD